MCCSLHVAFSRQPCCCALAVSACKPACPRPLSQLRHRSPAVCAAPASLHCSPACRCTQAESSPRAKQPQNSSRCRWLPTRASALTPCLRLQAWRPPSPAWTRSWGTCPARGRASGLRAERLPRQPTPAQPSRLRLKPPPNLSTPLRHSSAQHLRTTPTPSQAPTATRTRPGDLSALPSGPVLLRPAVHCCTPEGAGTLLPERVRLPGPPAQHLQPEATLQGSASEQQLEGPRSGAWTPPAH